MNLKGACEQKVISFNNTSKTVFENYEGVDVIRLGIVGVLASQPIALNYRQEINKLLKNFEPDIIHVHLPNPLAVLSLLSVDIKNSKVVVHWHSDIVRQRFLKIFYKPFENLFLKRADKIITTSHNLLHGSDTLPYFSEKVVVFPLGMDFKKLEIGYKPQRENKVFFVGRHVPYKGLEYLIKAAPFIKGKIVIAGEGPLSEKLKKMASGLDNVSFIGKVSNDEKLYHLYTSKVFAFPSISKNEAFGLAMVEALYCGTPAVCFEIEGSGVGWVNQNNLTGFVVENGNHIAFADAINRLLQNDELWNAMSQRAKEWAIEQFSLEKFISNVV
ncbi:MAG: glycosyltransferase, partial [Aquificaceae bacterium]